MKALFMNADANVSGPDLWFGIYDNTNSFVTAFSIQPLIGTDINPTTAGQTLTPDISAMVISTAAGHGYTIASSDIIWNGYCPFYPGEIAAMQNAIPGTPVYSTPTFSSATAATKLSATRDTQVSYDIDAVLTISILAGQSVTATLQYADDSGMSTNVVTVSSQVASISGLLGLSNTQTLKVAGRIPANKFRKVTFAVTGSAATPTSLKSAQEVLI